MLWKICTFWQGVWGTVISKDGQLGGKRLEEMTKRENYFLPRVMIKDYVEKQVMKK